MSQFNRLSLVVTEGRPARLRNAHASRNLSGFESVVDHAKHLGKEPPVEASVSLRGQSTELLRGISAAGYGGVDVDEVSCCSTVVKGVHLARHHIVGMQDQTDLHLNGRLGAPIGNKFDPVRLIRASCLTNVQPGEGIQTEIDHDVESFAFIGGDDRIHGGGKVRASLPVSEEIDVFTRPVDDAMRGDSVPSGQSETERTTRAQADFDKKAV